MRNKKSDIVDMLWRVIQDRDHARDGWRDATRESRLLAMLAAKTPQFFNPLLAIKAEQIRDRILSENVQAMASADEKTPPKETTL